MFIKNIINIAIKKPIAIDIPPLLIIFLLFNFLSLGKSIIFKFFPSENAKGIEILEIKKEIKKLKPII
tara:strand:+ start:275 stop:478 length:204 start_codon:yes stop_codon:yes gene_type:complete